ncbi:penicillin-binding protein 2 [Gemmatirosa kalamazoonensis]|uniref:Beta-lactamase n=1 Tax=Gemmatirosa kalamazoonensis TaxID=861299 RepID=W0RKG4_9BACT|nr:penicillin-binding protein 2 [Gemmatirosa kalamazoonensis]AHG90932.1 penicillin-binding protein 2 [Gemmatirosa kalamazoonensis]
MSFHPNDIARRSRGARVLLVASFVLLGSAFYRAQVLHHAEYVMQSEENRLREVPLPAPRGIIYDRNGKVIAENLPGYTVSVLSPSPDSLRETLRRLNAVIPFTDDDIATAVRRFNRAPNRPAVILADANFAQVSVLEEHRTEFPSLIIQSTPKRWYPDGPSVASIIGYTGEISEAELTKPEFSAYKAGMRIGKGGLERQYENVLRGREGYRFVEVDARGRVVREAPRDDQQPEAAPALYTNIDLDLQKLTQSLFGDTLQGAAVAIDPQTGGVLALVSAPSYDPNRFTGGIPKAYYDSLNTDPRRPLYNKAIQGRYAPGSTFKLATAIAGLEKGLVNLDTHMDQPCTGGFSFGRGYWRCWDKRGHGNVNLAQAIEKSCDVYFYQLGLKLQLSELVAGGLRLHMNDRTGIDLPSEMRPLFPSDPREYFRKKYGRNFVPASTAINMSIGQGENAQTVINMARFYAALANDGIMPRPTIARLQSPRQRVYNLPPDQLAGIRKALAGVVSERGTAAGAAIQGVAIAGKTGTAQSGQFDPATGKELNHAWFTGFAPADKPRIVVAVMLEKVPFHGSVSARIASQMISFYLKAQATVDEAVTNGG